MTLEQRKERIKRLNKCLTVALRLLALACALFVNPTIPMLGLITHRRNNLQKA